VRATPAPAAACLPRATPRERLTAHPHPTQPARRPTPLALLLPRRPPRRGTAHQPQPVGAGRRHHRARVPQQPREAARRARGARHCCHRPVAAARLALKTPPGSPALACARPRLLPPAQVPFRNSKLTQLLQDSLTGQAKVMMFMHVGARAGPWPPGARGAVAGGSVCQGPPPQRSLRTTAPAPSPPPLLVASAVRAPPRQRPRPPATARACPLSCLPSACRRSLWARWAWLPAPGRCVGFVELQHQLGRGSLSRWGQRPD
jgi:hypothetical protein